MLGLQILALIQNLEIFRNFPIQKFPFGHRRHCSPSKTSKDMDTKPSKGDLFVSSSSTEGSKSPKRVRWNGANSDEESDGGDANGGPGYSRKKPKTTDHSVSWACPYFKRNPVKYYECVSLKMSKISYVTQHLKRRHTISNPYCPRCRDEFKTFDERDNHAARGNCQIRDLVNSGKMTLDQKANIAKCGVRGKSDESKWLMMWNVLFPNIPTPDSPYVQHPFIEALQSMRFFYQNQGSEFVDGLFGEGNVAAVDGLCQHFQQQIGYAASSREQHITVGKIKDRKAYEEELVSRIEASSTISRLSAIDQSASNFLASGIEGVTTRDEQFISPILTEFPLWIHGTGNEPVNLQSEPALASSGYPAEICLESWVEVDSEAIQEDPIGYL
jgi:hypothetical protein